MEPNSRNQEVLCRQPETITIQPWNKVQATTNLLQTTMKPSQGNHGAKTTEPEVYPGTQEYFAMEPGSEPCLKAVYIKSIAS